MPITIRFEGISEAVGTLKGVPEDLARSVIMDMATAAYDSAEAGASEHSKTGAMLQSLVNRGTADRREVGHLDPGEGTRHALFINFGTKPHVIMPKNPKGFLRWAKVGSKGRGKGADFIFAKKVHHPGTQADAYMTKAATDALREFRSIVDRRFQEAVK